MPKLNLRTARRIKTASGEVLRLKGQGFEWARFLPMTATGGTITDIDVDGRRWRVHTFTTSGDFVVSDLGDSDGSVEYLIVGGGGSGGLLNGDTVASGGGGGGDVAEGATSIGAGGHTIVVGGGGPKVTSTGNGIDGSPSSAFGVWCGGGGGGGRHGLPGNNAVNGGGGGGASQDGQHPVGGVGTRNGGRGFGSATTASRSGGGGAGAGAAGEDATEGHNGAGGIGKGSSISGVLAYYGNGAPGTRGARLEDIVPGEDGTGDGGTGTGAGSVGSAPGGSGIVIIRYPLEAA